jgi:hypothetical protein
LIETSFGPFNKVGLIVDPVPNAVDPTSMDLHLDSVEYARVWNISAYQGDLNVHGIQDRNSTWAVLIMAN